tara:strand:- start:1023 stop:1328 length:306 start_codon:yes stop_codon:yes gene_type:complete
MSFTKKRKIIKDRILSLQDKVSNALIDNPDVDKFLDSTTLFDEWEEIIPDPEYGIFVIAVLNNIRKKTIIDKIIDSILKIEPASKKQFSKSSKTAKQHPFC